MKNLFQSAALVTITALLVSVGRGDAEQTAPIAYGEPFQLICASGTIDDAMMFNECTAFPVGAQGGAVTSPEANIQPGDTVTVGSDGCELELDGEFKSIPAGTEITIIDVIGNRVPIVEVGGDVGLVPIECLDLNRLTH